VSKDPYGAIVANPNYYHNKNHVQLRKVKRLIPSIIILVVVGAGIWFSFFDTSKRVTDLPEVQEEEPQEVPRLSTLAQNLEIPWGMVFLPDGGVLVTERPGRVRLIDKSGVLSPTPVANISDVVPRGEGGLHGIALHPNFSTNRLVYLYFTYESDGSQTLNQVARFVYNGQTLRDKEIIIDKIPGSLFHDGGRIKFGPDNFLYVTTGDAQQPDLAQSLSSLAGKILRMTDKGDPAPGNPFDNFVYSYGHRNPQGITWDDRGRLWETEHGQTATDELNLIEPGKNYGWPDIRGSQEVEGMVTPTLNSESDTWAPASAAYFNGSIFFTGLRGQALYEAKIEGESVSLKEHLKQEFGRIRNVIVGPDNFLYISTSNRDGRSRSTAGDDKIIRVNPEKL
jgi:glucose/arabinose dehydrogenase